MKLNMNKEELRKFLLHAPQSSIIKYEENIHPVDILDVLRDYPKDKKDILNRLPEELIADIIDEAEDDEKYLILMEFSENKQKNIVEEMSSDELTDLLGMLDEEQVNKILAKMTDEDSRKVRQLLSYDPDTAAGIMATEFVSLKENMTVEETLKYLQSCGEESENIYDLYVVDSFDRLKGVISLKELVTHNFNTKISDIIHTNVEGVLFNTDQEEVGHRFEKYGYLTMPVVDSYNRLLGIVTVDDVMQILRDETTEDIHRLGGVDEGEKVDGALRDSVKSRLPWLIINLFTAILASAVVGFFEGTIQTVVSLATFMPIVTGMGGNAGTQTISIIIRNIAMGKVSLKDSWHLLRKEILLGVIDGAVIGIVTSGIVSIMYGNYYLGIIAFLAMVANLIISGVSGILIPLILQKLKIDPALSSSIFLTTATDVLGFFIFLSLAKVFLVHLI